MKLTRINNQRLEGGELLLFTKFGRDYLIQTVNPDSGHIELINRTTHKKEAQLSYDETWALDAILDD